MNGDIEILLRGKQLYSVLEARNVEMYHFVEKSENMDIDTIEALFWILHV